MYSQAEGFVSQRKGRPSFMQRLKKCMEVRPRRHRVGQPRLANFSSSALCYPAPAGGMRPCLSDAGQWCSEVQTTVRTRSWLCYLTVRSDEHVASRFP